MIKVENLRKAFGERLLFDSVSLKIERGDFVGIYGPSGSGKTTLLSLLSLSDPDYGGLIEIDGQDLRELRGRERPSFALRNVARVYGENNLVDYLTARENALLPLYFQSLPLIQGELTRLSSALGVADVLERKAGSLSEGEKQRIALLRSLLSGQSYLLLDEPTSHLDEKNARKLASLLSEIAKTERPGILMATHDEGLLPYFSHVYRIVDGRLDG